MAIGNYWECVLPEGAGSPPLQRVVGESETMARWRFNSWRFDPDGEDAGGAEFAFMGFRRGEIRAVVHLVRPDGRTNFYLHSAFPWLAAGSAARLCVRRIHANYFGLEGFIEARTALDSCLNFFDPLLALNKDRYRIAPEAEFSLAAVSLDLKITTEYRLRITNPQTIAVMRGAERAAVGAAWSPPEYVEVDATRAQGLLQASADAPDYYLFQGLVGAVRETDFLDRPFLSFRTEVLRSERGGLSVDIYVDKARFGSRCLPAVGDAVSGTFWLQGQLLGEEQRSALPRRSLQC